MSDAAELRLFAEVCRGLSDRSCDPDEKASWLRLARKWQRMESADQPGVPLRLQAPEARHTDVRAG